ncbi:MAG TPA: response regulator transcription factor [Rhodanobacteraceae bacterium]|jgi:DNA-binding NarL/FixJ family response regulator|nr:response regulator transcription factor [Rhodanobacteraceae bacterium]
MSHAILPELVPLRLATVEDDPRYRGSLALLLRGLPAFNLVASYARAEPLLDAARKARELGMPPPWDVVLTDMGLPDKDGVALTREVKLLFPQLRVLVLTVFDEPARVLAAICAGADGYLLKSASNQELIEQLQLVIDHGAPMSAALAGTMMRLVRESNSDRFGTASLPRDLGLSPRQLAVLRGLVEGLSYREIGERLDISLDTVRSHIRQIYAALQVHSVAEAVGYALRHGLA